jgi:peptidyl-prolyl cis-trans isomerase SurA
MLDQAAIDSITVSSQQVDQRINQRIDQSIQQLGSERALEEQMGKSIVQIRADLREDYREQMIVQRFQQQKREEVDITRPEVKEFYESIPKDSLPVVPEQVAVSQIVIEPPTREDARQEALSLAKQLRDSVLNHGKTIEELAKRHGDGPSASDGGKLPLISLDELVPEYSAAAAALEPGGISEVVETSFGFHVIRLNKRVGDQIDTNHILISVAADSYDNQAAIDRLNALRDSLQNNEDVTFSELAREYSDDPNTAPQGGRILNPQTGQRLLTLEELDPALYRIVLLLDEEGDISEPKAFQLGDSNNSRRAYRIVRLDQHVPEHVANLEQDYQRIKQVALQEKQQEYIDELISDLRQEMYVEYKIPIPDRYEDPEEDPIL